MEKKELVNILTDILKPVGFKKKGNYWVKNGSEINKVVNLQKSQFGNYFYINYGYIINSIPLDGDIMHILRRVASTDKIENKLITDLLDLEFNNSDNRKEQLKEILLKYLLTPLLAVETETDILEELNKQTNLNNIPIVVKKYFNLPTGS